MGIQISGDNKKDIEALIGAFNDYQDNAGNKQQLNITAAGTISVVITDGGFSGATYTGSITHNLGYAPIFIVYSGDTIRGYTNTPDNQYIFGGGTPSNLFDVISAYSDSIKLYVTIAIKSPFGATPPFFVPGTSFPFVYVICKNPIANV